MTLASLPLFVRLAGRPVMLIGDGEAAAAKRRLLERAGAIIVGEDGDARLAIVAIEEDSAAAAAVARLNARGVLVNAVDRPHLCDFTLPAIVERGPVLVAIGTSGVSAGLAAALRQRLETVLPSWLGELALGLQHARAALRARYPDPIARRRAIGSALAAGGALDPLGAKPDVAAWLDSADTPPVRSVAIIARSADPDDLTLRDARALANADVVIHAVGVPTAILDRARADAVRIEGDTSPECPASGLTVYVRMA